ncbi:MAG: AAA family ATPase [Planctomycetota bacterium]|nr:AAA family ATPase [Planctomycetota bacterium]
MNSGFARRLRTTIPRMPRSLPISGLEIRNFRCFERLRVDGLTRVNLIVGTNNSGKTALLEAIEAVVSDMSPFILYRASVERGESHVRSWGSAGEDHEINVRHWFHGHTLAEGTSFSVRATGERERFVSRTIERVPSDAPAPPFVPGGFQIALERPGMRKNTVTAGLPLLPDGSLGAGPPSTFTGFGALLHPPVGFMTTQRLPVAELTRLWAGIVLTPREDSTIAALRLVEPTIERVAMSGSGDAASVQVLLRGASSPVPLGTLGEGVSRILAIALQLASSQGGFLLIDEIESGLHWSVMPKFWRFLVQAAREFDVQLFATTHSKDCIEAIARLHREDPGLTADITVHRIEAGKTDSVRIDARVIELAIDGEQEVR